MEGSKSPERNISKEIFKSKMKWLIRIMVFLIANSGSTGWFRRDINKTPIDIDLDIQAGRIAIPEADSTFTINPVTDSLETKVIK